MVLKGSIQAFQDHKKHHSLDHGQDTIENRRSEQTDMRLWREQKSVHMTEFGSEFSLLERVKNIHLRIVTALLKS